MARLRTPLLVMLVAGVLGAKGLEAWVAATELPRRLAETSVELRDRAGRLLRAYPVEDGIWRMAVRAEDVDPTYLQMLRAYEDKRFDTHMGVDPLAMLRAAG